MARRIAVGDEAGAVQAQNRAIELTLLLSIPCIVAFLLVPELIMRALFMRGAFTAADAAAAGETLAAYAIGLLPFVLVRSVIATFLARGDTATPVRAALSGRPWLNVAFKAVSRHQTSLAQVGLAFATSIRRRLAQSRPRGLVSRARAGRTGVVSPRLKAARSRRLPPPGIASSPVVLRLAERPGRITVLGRGRGCATRRPAVATPRRHRRRPGVRRRNGDPRCLSAMARGLGAGVVRHAPATAATPRD